VSYNYRTLQEFVIRILPKSPGLPRRGELVIAIVP